MNVRRKIEEREKRENRFKMGSRKGKKKRRGYRRIEWKSNEQKEYECKQQD